MIKKYGFIILLVIVGLVWYGVHEYYTPDYINGEEAPNFNAELIDGSAFQLNDLRGQYVLLDFWGSWCAPCRQQNPKLVRLYQEFHDQQFDKASNFEIVSVALEMKKERWLKAIQNDQLNWPYHHATFDRMNSPIANLYGVNEIPTTFLINPEGDIAGVNMTYDEIRSFLSDRLAG